MTQKVQSFFLSLCIQCLFISVGKSQGEVESPAQYIWVDETGEGRNQYVYFRYDLELEERAKEALIHLYASSRYHLKVNGTFINFGPLRSFPENPVYDTYDISPYLKTGKNTIAVKVMHNG